MANYIDLGWLLFIREPNIDTINTFDKYDQYDLDKYDHHDLVNYFVSPDGENITFAGCPFPKATSSNLPPA